MGEFRNPLCAYFEHDETLAKPDSPVVFNDFHEAADGPLYFFVPVNGRDAVRVAVCEEHCRILEGMYPKDTADLAALRQVYEAAKGLGRRACYAISEKVALSQEEWDAALCHVCPACLFNAAIDRYERHE